MLKLTAPLFAATAALLLAACGAEHETTSDATAADHSVMDHSGHEMGAVEKSEVALKYAKDAKAGDLATRVIAAQKAEIAEMKALLEARDAQSSPTSSRGRYSADVGGTSVTTVQLKDIPIDELFHSTPDELFTGSRRPLPRERTPAGPTKKERITAALTGGDGINIAPIDDTAANTDAPQ